MVESDETVFQIAAVVHGKKVREFMSDRVVYDSKHWLLAPQWLIRKDGEQSGCFEAWIVESLGIYMERIRQRDDILGEWEFSLDINATASAFVGGKSVEIAGLTEKVSYIELIQAFSDRLDVDVHRGDLLLRLSAAVERNM